MWYNHTLCKITGKKHQLSTIILHIFQKFRNSITSRQFSLPHHPPLFHRLNIHRGPLFHRLNIHRWVRGFVIIRLILTVDKRPSWTLWTVSAVLLSNSLVWSGRNFTDFKVHLQIIYYLSPISPPSFSPILPCKIGFTKY